MSIVHGDGFHVTSVIPCANNACLGFVATKALAPPLPEFPGLQIGGQHPVPPSKISPNIFIKKTGRPDFRKLIEVMIEDLPVAFLAAGPGIQQMSASCQLTIKGIHARRIFAATLQLAGASREAVAHPTLQYGSGVRQCSLRQIKSVPVRDAIAQINLVAAGTNSSNKSECKNDTDGQYFAPGGTAVSILKQPPVVAEALHSS